MPSKLKLALGLMGIGVLLALIGERWFSVIINLALMFGIWRGNESIRGFMIGISWIGLILNIIVAVVSFGAAFVTFGLTLIPFAAGVWGAVQCAYMIWALKQPEVQHWMFNRSLKLV
ncbi:MAG: hypothetical protein IPM79_31340 [Polyangiaceae bacterium]|jgi:hypothetical protein|nr:hypothetical protein [Polyangiaceae bacterium]MBK8941979.1 hypothetical protein [Polyangiaceae bacterium]